MLGEIIVKIQKSHYSQMPHHAHSNYIQTSNQAIRDQKPIKKCTNNPKTKKNYTKMENFHKNMWKKGI